MSRIKRIIHTHSALYTICKACEYFDKEVSKIDTTFLKHIHILCICGAHRYLKSIITAKYQYM